MHVIYFITAESYKEREVLVEAESLCNLPVHYLLGLLIYLKQNIMINDKEKSNKGRTLVKDIEKLLLHIKIDEIVMNIDNAIEGEVYVNEESNRFVCEEGINILKMLDLFEYYTKSERISNIKSMLKVLGIIKKVPIEEKYEGQKVFEVKRNLKKVKHKIIKYELNTPISKVQTPTSQEDIKRAIIDSSISVSTNTKPNDYRKLYNSKSDFGLLNEPVTMFCKDTIPNPSFMISSQKGLDVVAKKQKEKWNMLYTNSPYLSYKSS